MGLQIRNLCRHKIREDMLEQLSSLPVELADVYADIYGQLSKAGARAQRLVMIALKWLACAEKPICNRDFVTAVCFSSTAGSESMKASTFLEIGHTVQICDALLGFSYRNVWARFSD